MFVKRSMHHVVAVALVLATVPVSGQQAQRTSAEWRALVEGFPPGQFVSVRLNDKSTVKGTLVAAGPAGLSLRPHTRLPVAIRTIPYDAVVSLEPKGRPWSAGRKAATVIGVGAGVFLLLGIAAASAAGDLLSGP